MKRGQFYETFCNLTWFEFESHIIPFDEKFYTRMVLSLHQLKQIILRQITFFEQHTLSTMIRLRIDEHTNQYISKYRTK